MKNTLLLVARTIARCFNRSERYILFQLKLSKFFVINNKLAQRYYCKYFFIQKTLKKKQNQLKKKTKLFEFLFLVKKTKHLVHFKNRPDVGVSRTEPQSRIT